MDPITALGAVTTVFSLVGYCVKGFVVLTDAQNIGKASSTLICQLSVQELRLIQWADRAGLLSKSGELDGRLRPCARVINDVLGQLKDHLYDTDAICRRYHFRLSTSRPNDTRSSATPTSGSDILDNVYFREARTNILLRARLIHHRNSWPKRLWWAAMDSRDFEDLVVKIKGFVNDLWDLLGPLDVSLMMNKMDTILSQVIALNGKVSDLQPLQKALTRTDNEEELASAAYLRMTKLEMEASDEAVEDEMPEPSSQLEMPKVNDLSMENITGLKPMDGSPHMGLAKYDGESVFVEYAVYKRSEFRAGGSQSTLIIKRSRNAARFLNAPKHPVFRSLRCKGVAVSEGENAKTIAFVFRLPNSSISKCVSLRQLLGSGDGTLPSVTARMDLAYRLLQTVRFTHTAGWLHRNIRSENIIFFLPSAVAAVPKESASLPSPTLVGFSLARLADASVSVAGGAEDPPRDIYKHPRHLNAGNYVRYEAYMDIYALATVLVEIAEWMPLSRLVRSVIDVKVEDYGRKIWDVRPFLIKALDSGESLNVKFRMGDTYHKYTRLCLNIKETMPQGVKLRQAGDGIEETLEPRSELQQALDIVGEAATEIGKCRV